MPPLTAIFALCLLGATSSVEGLSCNEGFNMSLSGIPMYHWKERTCTDNSKCFGQELMVKLPLGDLNFDLVLRYGACLSSAYADYLDCDKLFGANSIFDPANLLDLIPNIVDRFNDTIYDFVMNSVMEVKKLFSNGKNVGEFIDGIFLFHTNMGFNMAKAEPLKAPLATLLEKSFAGNHAEIGTATIAFFNAFANLDTANPKLTNALKKLIAVLDPTNELGSNPALMAVFDPLIKKGPGLAREILPTTWELPLWYDVIFELFDDIDSSNWTKTAENMVATIKSSYNITKEALDVLNPLFDRIPQLVAGSLTNPGYIGSWSLELMKAYSDVDSATTEFSNALINFVEALTSTTLHQEFKTMIKWMPGLFYKAFPGDKAVIQDVYKKMAAGFDSFNFTNLNDTAEPSKLSDLVIKLFADIAGTPMNVIGRAFVVNFARMFYNLLSDYKAYVDVFADVLSEGLKDYPSFNAGQIVKNLITGMNGTVPAEIDPLLTNVQTIINATMKTPFAVSDLYTAFSTVINAYKTAFPDSPFPELVQRYINIIKGPTELSYFDPDYQKKMFDLQMEQVYWTIDFQFAIFSINDAATNNVDQMLIKAFPAYETMIKLMRTMKADDVKELVKKIVEWMVGGNLTPESFVAAVKPSVQKITKSITNLLGDLKKLVAPDFCRFGSCATDLCNSQLFINKRAAATNQAVAVTDILTTATSDNDECVGEGGGHDCHSSATCWNTDGSFTCACNVGYYGDGKNCNDHNECVGEGGGHDCHSSATCLNTDGSFTCTCNVGYNGDGKNCADVDECSTDKNICPSGSTCINTVGSFTCACSGDNSGSTFKEQHKCSKSSFVIEWLKYFTEGSGYNYKLRVKDALTNMTKMTSVEMIFRADPAIEITNSLAHPGYCITQTKLKIPDVVEVIVDLTVGWVRGDKISTIANVLHKYPTNTYRFTFFDAA